jgi:putative tryptophan/tyrosine transport system substrate-binding protein
MKASPCILSACAAAVLMLFTTQGAAQPADNRPVVGYLVPGERSAATSDWVEWFRDGLRRRGFFDGENIRIVLRFSDGDPDRLSELARELAAAGSQLIVTRGTTAVRAAELAVPTLPIVTAGSADPVAMGFAKSLARPGGRITGVSILGAEMIGKRMELLKEAVPAARRIVAFLQAANPGNAAFRDALKASADALDVQLQIREIREPGELEEAFEWAAREGDGVFLIEDPMFFRHRQVLLQIAARRRLPVITGNAEYARAGALAVYAIDDQTAAHEAARLVAEILRGANPAELPIAQPTRFRLVINLRTARALGIEIPLALLVRTDEVIE